MSLIEGELLKLKNNLQKALDDNDELLCCDILNVLNTTTVTLDSLIKTKVGHTVKDVKNKYSNTKTSTIAKDLMADWKKVAEVQQDKKEVIKEKEKEIVKEEIKDSNSIDIKKINNNNNSDSNNNSNNNSPRSNDDVFDVSSMYSNLNDKRKKVVEELAKALEQSVNAAISTFLAYNIEGAINKFKPLDRDGKGYFDKAKSLIFNLKRNERRRQELAEGYLTAEELINLSPTELATDELRSSREKDKLAASWERRTDFYIATRDERLKSNGIDPAAGGEFQCRKCKSTKCTHYALQTRSSDEPMTVFVCCLQCGNQWRC